MQQRRLAAMPVVEEGADKFRLVFKNSGHSGKEWPLFFLPLFVNSYELTNKKKSSSGDQKQHPMRTFIFVR